MIVVIDGPAGSGKSTVARCVMNIYRPSGGQVFYKGIDTCDPRAFRINRRMLQSTRQIIFQDSSSSLNQRMKVCDIIAEPMRIQHVVPPRGSLRAEAAFQMRYVGLDASYLDKYPPELSGGQRQRVAIARSILSKPKIIFADEPTGNLDKKTALETLELLIESAKKFGQTLIIVTHDLEVARMSETVITIEDGRVIG